MADTKITALAAIATVDPAADVLPIVDISDTSMAASGTTKKVTSNQILGAGGTATLASATITGDLTVDTSTLKVDSTNNRVGIGIASPIDVFQISSPNPNVYITDSGVGGSDQANLYLGVNTVPTYAGILVDFSNDILNVRHNQATRLSIGSTGNVSVSTGNVVMATSGKGIDFSATSGTGTSELLADYEEGTFTPTVVGSTTAGVGVYASQIGRYTKVGNLVTVNVFLDWTAHTGTGNLLFGGLPFNTNSDATTFTAFTIGYATFVTLTANNVLTAFAEAGVSNIGLFQYPVGGGQMTAVPIDTAAVVIYTGTYRV